MPKQSKGGQQQPVPPKSRPEALAELQAVYGALEGDLNLALAYGRADDTPYARRAFVRAHFALVEGLSFHMRQLAVASVGDSGFLTPAELSLLREEVHQLDRNGRPETAARHLSFPSSLLFSMRCYAKIHGASFEPDTAGAGWEAMRKAVAIRNRMTHPKALASLDLSEEDTHAFVAAANWWKHTLLGLFAACNEADAYWKEHLGKEQLAAKAGTVIRPPTWPKD